MSSKTKKDREVTRLRREVEILKAQLSSRGQTRPKKAPRALTSDGISQTPEPNLETGQFLRRDLSRTAAITLVCFALLGALFLTHYLWFPYIADLF